MKALKDLNVNGLVWGLLDVMCILNSIMSVLMVLIVGQLSDL